jgi:hypothetical protein
MVDLPPAAWVVSKYELRDLLGTAQEILGKRK